MTGNVLFLGNALLDISSPCEASLLEKYDLKPDENSEATEKQDSLFEDLLKNPDTLLTPGGSAQNSARVMQWVLSSYGTGQAYFIGCIGKDQFGEKLQQSLKKSGVKTFYFYHNTAPTGLTAGLVTPDGKRSLCARLGAALQFDKKHFSSPEVFSAMESSNIFYAEGYFFAHNPSAVLEVAKFAEKHCKRLAINLSADYICEQCFEPLNECIAMATIVIGNKQEAETFVKKCGFQYDDLKNCAQRIASLPGKGSLVRIVVITQGPDPVIVAVGNSSGPKVYSVPVVENLGDTIGCGDAFVGGFLAALSLEMTDDVAVNCGIYCATEVAKLRGCTLPFGAADLEKIKLCRNE